MAHAALHACLLAGMGLIEAAAASMKRRGLLEDAKLSAQLAVARTFGAARRLLRHILRVPPHAHPPSRHSSSTVESVQRHGHAHAAAPAWGRGGGSSGRHGVHGGSDAAAHADDDEGLDGAPMASAPHTLARSKSAHACAAGGLDEWGLQGMVRGGKRTEGVHSCTHAHMQVSACTPAHVYV